MQLWVDSVDVWPSSWSSRSRATLYLVTESVPQPPCGTTSLLTHLTWFPKPDRLTEQEFFHGWHVVHTPVVRRAAPAAAGLPVRDAVARTLTAGSPAVRAIVCELLRRRPTTSTRRGCSAARRR